MNFEGRCEKSKPLSADSTPKNHHKIILNKIRKNKAKVSNRPLKNHRKKSFSRDFECVLLEKNPKLPQLSPKM